MQVLERGKKNIQKLLFLCFRMKKIVLIQCLSPPAKGVKDLHTGTAHCGAGRNFHDPAEPAKLQSRLIWCSKLSAWIRSLTHLAKGKPAVAKANSGDGTQTVQRKHKHRFGLPARQVFPLSSSLLNSYVHSHLHFDRVRNPVR